MINAAGGGGPSSPDFQRETRKMHPAMVRVTGAWCGRDNCSLQNMLPPPTHTHAVDVGPRAENTAF